jgi:hypothetical protein
MLQLQKIRHPNGTRCIGAGIAALAFSFHDGGDTITSVTADKTHTVSVWRWSKGGDAGAPERVRAFPNHHVPPPRSARLP